MVLLSPTGLIVDIFNTSPTDPNISETSSYLDLASLYGSSQSDQDKVRAKVDGMLKPDCFFDSRILGFPPGVGVLLAGFNRFHNYIVGEMAVINEGGRFSLPDLKTIVAKIRVTNPTWAEEKIAAAAKDKFEAALTKRDEDLFQTGRLYVSELLSDSRVTCGLYVNCILYDYLRTIISLNRTNDPWILDPRARGPEVYSSQGTPMGVGNQVSCEFNLLYRWHSTISPRDEKWLQEFMQTLFPGKDMSKMGVDEFRMGLYRFGKSVDPDPAKREWGGLKRDENGKFDDAALVKELNACTEDCAGMSLLIPTDYSRIRLWCSCCFACC
jgi:linoleate 10R-lipoxygenase